MNKDLVEIKSSRSYQLAERIARLMDKYYLDAVLGFLLEGFGDLLTQLLTLPYIYVSAVKIRSVPLTLAVIYNALCDIAMGLIPFYVGDVFNKSFVRNFKLIVGFVEGDKKVISEINRKAVRMAVLIVMLCVIIYFLVLLTIKVMTWFWHVIAGLF
jgi:succinate-acetate transporter protein